MMIEEIKPCPFCESDRLDHTSNGCESVYVECGNCGASGPASEDYTSATSAWNKRASDTEIATLTAKLAESEKQLAEAESDNVRLKLIEESALKVCAQLDEVVCALPIDYLDLPDGGDASVGEQVRRMAKDAARYRWLRAQSDEVIDAEYEVCRKYGHKFYPLTAMLDDAIDAAIRAMKEE